MKKEKFLLLLVKLKLNFLEKIFNDLNKLYKNII